MLIRLVERLFSIIHSNDRSKRNVEKEELISAPADLILADRLAFLKLPIEERRRILTQQADDLMAHYTDQTALGSRTSGRRG
jgi:hypothetical protein